MIASPDDENFCLTSYEGQIAGCSSTEFGLANMIWAAVSVGQVGYFVKLIFLLLTRQLGTGIRIDFRVL
jgi:hypothetical protein